MTLNASQHELTKTLPFQRGHKNVLSTCVDENHPMTSLSSQNIHFIMCWQNASLAREDTKCFSTCVDRNPIKTPRPKWISKSVEETKPMPAKTQIVSQYELNKPLLWQRGNKMHLNLCWTNPSIDCNRHNWHKSYRNLCWTNHPHVSEDTKCISTCVDKTQHMPARIQNASHLVLTKHLPC